MLVKTHVDSFFTQVMKFCTNILLLICSAEQQFCQQLMLDDVQI